MLGQTVNIEVNQKNIQGEIERIDPNIKGTTIEIDIALLGDISNARINMFVSGVVIVNKIQDTLFVSKPAMAIENGNSKLFKMSANRSSATLVSVNTGLFSNQNVQIHSGLDVGDSIILSELQSLGSTQSILIK